jgi:hypothetical protein
MAVRAMVPPEVMAECRAKAVQLQGKPKTWIGAAAIVAIWLGVSGAAIYWLIG